MTECATVPKASTKTLAQRFDRHRDKGHPPIILLSPTFYICALLPPVKMRPCPRRLHPQFSRKWHGFSACALGTLSLDVWWTRGCLCPDSLVTVASWQDGAVCGGDLIARSEACGREQGAHVRMRRHDALSRILQTSNVPHGTIVCPDSRTCGDIDGTKKGCAPGTCRYSLASPGILCL